MKHRTPAYWPTRILLAVGLVATVTAFALTLVVLLGHGSMFGPRPDVLGFPADKVVAIAGLLPVVVGFGWMLRIFRGPRDAPAS